MKRASVAPQSVVAGKTISDFSVASVPGKHGEFRFAIFSFRLISFYSATRRLNQWLPVRQCLTFWESNPRLLLMKLATFVELVVCPMAVELEETGIFSQPFSPVQPELLSWI